MCVCPFMFVCMHVGTLHAKQRRNPLVAWAQYFLFQCHSHVLVDRLTRVFSRIFNASIQMPTSASSKELKDDMTLQEYNIVEGSSIHLLFVE